MDSQGLTREQSRAVDRDAIGRLGVAGVVLMENAGRGCVDLMERVGIDGPVVVLCGKGNNGGDGFVIARHLIVRGHAVVVVLLAPPEDLTGDALFLRHLPLLSSRSILRTPVGLRFCPPNGGAISPDFGLPREAKVANRVPNPIYIPVQGAAARTDTTWEAAADVLRDYFPIQSEQNVRLTGGVLTEGRFETPWQTGATLFEPWRNDSVGAFNRWQSALQTIRRKATIRVIPAAGGYEVGVEVNKQLEDLSRPEHASAGAAALRNDASLPTDRLNPIDRIRSSSRWIDIGRDEPLEQEMLRRFRERLAG